MEKIINFIVTFITNYINFFDTIGNMEFIVNGNVYVMDHDFIMAMAFVMLGAVVGMILYAIANEILELGFRIKAEIRYRKNVKQLKKIANETNLITNN